MDDFAVQADRLSAEADERLGDLIQYSIAGEAYVAMKGRVDANEQPVLPRKFERLDEVQSGWRLRIAAALVPNPGLNDRVKCARVLGETVWRPANKDPVRDGRYWLIELQKVS